MDAVEALPACPRSQLILRTGGLSPLCVRPSPRCCLPSIQIQAPVLLEQVPTSKKDNTLSLFTLASSHEKGQTLANGSEKIC